VRLQRVHLEEDAGKAIHDRGDATLVDLNRAGIPLIEIVGEADLTSAAEAHEYLSALKEILRYARVSDCDMEKGSLRCDVNVSVHPPEEAWRAKVEVKNLNSFRHVRAAIEHEIERQVAGYEAGAPPVQETRLWDPEAGVTRTLRRKEDAPDYRYFPDPDLPPAIVDGTFLESQLDLVPELPAARRARYVAELGLSEYDAGVLTAQRELADLFEESARLCGDPKQAANWIANDLASALGDDQIPGETWSELRIEPAALAALLGLVEDGTLHRSAARKVLRGMLQTGQQVATVMMELGLGQRVEPGELEAWCREVIAGDEDTVAAYRAGKNKALGALIGAVMKASGGRADPARVRETLTGMLGE
jgi:aspartyl-tRNA(Asn)/glutamyl-tRNA(Gln) amidotransferase subunit B